MTHQVFRPGYSSITDYKWLLLVATFLAALLSFNGQISRGDENEGSGIGGTGRATVPGSESGLGGTGFRPYLGSSYHDGAMQPELVLQEDAALTPIAALVEHNAAASIPAPEMPIPRIVELVSPANATRNSAPISITEQIQHDLDRDVLLLQQAAEYRAEELEGYVNSPFLASSGLDATTASQSEAPNPEFASGEIVASGPDAMSELNWSRLAAMLAHSNSGSEDNADGDAGIEPLAVKQELETDRVQRPERIARPSLPPIQRVRPLQRPGLLPPRIRPMQF